MSTVLTSQSSTGHGIGLTVAAALALWFVLVFVLGAAGAFGTPPGTPPLPIFVGVVAPIVAFFLLYRLSSAFRDFVLSLDLRLATAIQAWRAAGLGFIALYAHQILPGSFAWPAGLGDLAIGLTAPWVMLALIRRPSFAGSKAFVAWNLLGLLDLVDAVSTGALSSALATGAPGEITTGPMAQLPLVLIPAYLVPIFVMLHAAALLQWRRLANN
jgi:hypothetical protein